MLFDAFPDEATFRATFVRPLLTKLGFLAIAELDGSLEFGKDFVFSELTPFGFFRHYGVVVKHERAIRQPSSRLCATILAQIRQAFSVAFRLPDSSQESHVSAVLVLNSGSITQNAAAWLRAELARERYGDNVHIFDGERLKQLDNANAFRHRELLVPRLTGLQIALKMNRHVWRSLGQSLPTFSEMRGCFTQALEDYIAAPVLPAEVDPHEIAVLLQECRIIDAVCRRYLVGLGVSKEIRENDVSTLRGIIKSADERAMLLLQAIQAALTNFGPIAR